MNSLTSFDISSVASNRRQKIPISINGKFLRPGAGKAGVYRVACELLLAMDSLLVTRPDLAERFSCKIIGSGLCPIDFSLKKLRFENTGRIAEFFSDTAWEQIVLPFAVRGEILVNLCNVGPGLIRNAVTMVHDAQVYESPKSYSLAFRLWYQLLQPLLGRTNKLILTVSGFSRDQLIKHGVANGSKIQVIHNGCDHVLRVTPDVSAVRRYGLAGRRYVLALSNTQRHKNIGILFEAFRSEKLSDVTLVLFGAATKADFERLGYSVPPNVDFIGRINDSELCALLKSAVALAFPSLTEGFGLPPLEAMALGCPAIVAPCGAVPEVCGKAAIWADANDPDQWFKAIERLLVEPGHSARVVAEGLAHASRFTWKNSAIQLLEAVSGEFLSVTRLDREQTSGSRV